MDDTCTALEPELVKDFHQHLNNIEDLIQFTCEIQEDGQLPFLDINLRKENDGTISTSVFRKRTHMDQYLQFSSHHPLAHKRSVVRTLFSRTSSLLSSLVQHSLEEKYIFDALRTNGYPKNLIQRRSTSQRSETEETKEKPAARVTLPYIQGVSEAIRWVLKNLDITTSFRPTTSLRKVLSHPKDPLPPSSRSGVIYLIPCRDCDKSYVSQTGRTLLQRVKEHQQAVKTMNIDSSALAEHAWNEHHHIAWEEATVLDQHPFLHSRCVMESWYINHILETLNREKGLLPETYLSLPSTLP